MGRGVPPSMVVNAPAREWVRAGSCHVLQKNREGSSDGSGIGKIYGSPFRLLALSTDIQQVIRCTVQGRLLPESVVQLHPGFPGFTLVGVDLSLKAGHNPFTPDQEAGDESLRFHQGINLIWMGKIRLWEVFPVIVDAILQQFEGVNLIVKKPVGLNCGGVAEGGKASDERCKDKTTGFEDAPGALDSRLPFMKGLQVIERSHEQCGIKGMVSDTFEVLGVSVVESVDDSAAGISPFLGERKGCIGNVGHTQLVSACCKRKGVTTRPTSDIKYGAGRRLKMIQDHTQGNREFCPVTIKPSEFLLGMFVVELFHDVHESIRML